MILFSLKFFPVFSDILPTNIYYFITRVKNNTLLKFKEDAKARVGVNLFKSINLDRKKSNKTVSS